MHSTKQLYFLICVAGFCYGKVLTASTPPSPPEPGSGCDCIKYNCGCCLDLHPLIKVEESLCINTTYLPEEYGVRMTWTLGNTTILNSTVSLRNPPPICVAVPYTKHVLGFCLTLYNITVTKENVHFCSYISVGVPIIIHEKVYLGCIDIPVRTHKKEEASLQQKISTFAPTWLLITTTFLILTTLSVTATITVYTKKIKPQTKKNRNDYVII